MEKVTYNNGKPIIVKYGYKKRPTGWEWEGYNRFDTFGEALKWCMDTRAEGKILGFRVIEIKKDIVIVKMPENWGCADRGFRYEGSTDAAIVGGRY